MRSKAALLLVLVAKKQGLQAVQELLPQLLSAAQESATHTEMVGNPSTPFSAGITLPATGRDPEHADHHTAYPGTSRRSAQGGGMHRMQRYKARRRDTPLRRRAWC